MHVITVDSARSLVEVVIKGLLEISDVYAYVEELTDKVTHSIGVGQPYVMLIDITECALQSQAVVDAFQAHIAAFPKARGLAIVNGNSLARLQLERILQRDYLRYFADRRTALKWLFDLPMS
jgi:hypothetical protein